MLTSNTHTDASLMHMAQQAQASYIRKLGALRRRSQRQSYDPNRLSITRLLEIGLDPTKIGTDGLFLSFWGGDFNRLETDSSFSTSPSSASLFEQQSVLTQKSFIINSEESQEDEANDIVFAQRVLSYEELKGYIESWKKALADYNNKPSLPVLSLFDSKTNNRRANLVTAFIELLETKLQETKRDDNDKQLTLAGLCKLTKCYIKMVVHIEQQQFSLTKAMTKTATKAVSVLFANNTDTAKHSSPADSIITMDDYKQLLEKQFTDSEFVFDLGNFSLKGFEANDSLKITYQIARGYDPFFSMTCQVLKSLSDEFKIHGGYIGYCENSLAALDRYRRELITAAFGLLKKEKHQNQYDYWIILQNTMLIDLRLTNKLTNINDSWLKNIPNNLAQFKSITGLENYLLCEDEMAVNLERLENYPGVISKFAKTILSLFLEVKRYEMPSVSAEHLTRPVPQ